MTPPGKKGSPHTLESREIYRGRVVELSVDRVRFPDGSSHSVEMIRHSGAAAILPITGARDDADPRILLIKQFRYAADGDLYEIPAGGRDPADASWEVCARRELEEETGMKAGKMVPLTYLYTTPGFTNEVIHLFLATELSPGVSNLGEDEILELVDLRFSEALEWVRTGKIIDGKTIAALLFVDRFVLAPGGRALSSDLPRDVPPKGRMSDEMA